MTKGRLPWLLAMLAALALLRWWMPPGQLLEAEAVSPAVVRSAQPMTAEAPMPSTDAAVDATMATRDTEPPRNAFAVREPRMAPPLPVPPAPLMATAPVLAGPTAHALPALKVIGTWDDGGPAAAFVSTPLGTQVVRAGEAFLSEYQVIAVTDQVVTLRHTASATEHQLAVPTVGWRGRSQ